MAAVDPHGAIMHAALVHGFGLGMMYGGVGACALAALSFMTFGRGAQGSKMSPAVLRSGKYNRPNKT